MFFIQFSGNLFEFSLSTAFDTSPTSVAANSDAVEATLEGSTYGDTPITSGTGVVLDMATPQAYELMQNYPNPFNPSTSIGFSLPQTGHVTVNVYDMTGRLVSTLVNDVLNEGAHVVDWNGQDNFGDVVSAGVYIYSLESSDMIMTKKMIFLK